MRTETFLVTAALAAVIAAPAVAQQEQEREHMEHGERAAAMVMHSPVIVLDSVAELLGLNAASKEALAPHIDGINAAFMSMRHFRDFDKEHASDEDREKQHTAMVEMRESMGAHHAAVAELLTEEQLEQLMTYVHARVDMTGMPGHDDDGHEEHHKKPEGRL